MEPGHGGALHAWTPLTRPRLHGSSVADRAGRGPRAHEQNLQMGFSSRRATTARSVIARSQPFSGDSCLIREPQRLSPLRIWRSRLPLKR
jgi:hypothetical protein